MKQILRVVGLSSAAWYGGPRRVGAKARPGPKPGFSDEKVLQELKSYLEAPVFYGEGYKKLVKRLWEFRGVKVAKERLLRLLRENELLAGERPEPNGSSREHDGTITTEAPDRMWGLDIKEWRCADGKLWTFSVIDHFNAEVIAERSCKRATQDIGSDVLRMAIKARFGSLRKGICSMLMIFLRTDHGAQFTGERFEKEMNYFGISWSPAFVRSPQCNGVIERYHKTMKQQIGHLIKRMGREDASRAISEFAGRYNEHWMLHRLGLTSPEEEKRRYNASAPC